jgi:hypothetical protein
VEDQLQKNIFAIAQWTEDVWVKVESLNKEDYAISIIELLTIGTYFTTLLAEYFSSLEIDHINKAIGRILMILAMIRAYFDIFESGEYTLSEKHNMLNNLREMREAARSDFKDILETYGLTGRF